MNKEDVKVLYDKCGGKDNFMKRLVTIFLDNSRTISALDKDEKDAITFDDDKEMLIVREVYYNPYTYVTGNTIDALHYTPYDFIQGITITTDKPTV